MTRLLRLLVAAALAVMAVAACAADDDGSPAAGGTSAPAAPSATSAPATGTSAPGGGEASGSPTSGGGGGTITIKDFKYGEPLTVAPGATIEVANEDTAGHDVVADDGSFRTPVLGQGEKATFTAPTRPGTYKFSCSLHPGSMSGIGTLIVQG
jgi:plastocyanin